MLPVVGWPGWQGTRQGRYYFAGRRGRVGLARSGSHEARQVLLVLELKGAGGSGVSQEQELEEVHEVGQRQEL